MPDVAKSQSIEGAEGMGRIIKNGGRSLMALELYNIEVEICLEMTCRENSFLEIACWYWLLGYSWI